MTEDYVWYVTNEYNFDKLPDPPAYEPTKCDQCAKVIIISKEEYSTLWKEYIFAVSVLTSDSPKLRKEQK